MKALVFKTSDNSHIDYDNILTLNTLDDLATFLDNHGEVVISRPDGYELNSAGQLPDIVLEIYDAYRE